jgi:hypothetical protein
MKKNGEAGQLIGGGWVNLLSAVTMNSERLCNFIDCYQPHGSCHLFHILGQI